MRVRVLDGRRVGAGASQASAGVLAPYVEGHDSAPAAHAGPAFARHVRDLRGARRRAFRPARGVRAAAARSKSPSPTPTCCGSRGRAALLAAEGVAAEWLEGAALRRGASPRCGPDAVGGLHDSLARHRARAGAHRGAAAAAVSLGAELSPGVAATGYRARRPGARRAASPTAPCTRRRSCWPPAPGRRAGAARRRRRCRCGRCADSSCTWRRRPAPCGTCVGQRRLSRAVARRHRARGRHVGRRRLRRAGHRRRRRAAAASRHRARAGVWPTPTFLEARARPAPRLAGRACRTSAGPRCCPDSSTPAATTATARCSRRSRPARRRLVQGDLADDGSAAGGAVACRTVVDWPRIPRPCPRSSPTPTLAIASRTCPAGSSPARAILKEFTFAGFPEAVAFVSRLVAPAEAADHHPDLTIHYRRVTVTFSTHSAGGLTVKDFAGAAAAEAVAAVRLKKPLLVARSGGADRPDGPPAAVVGSARLLRAVGAHAQDRGRRLHRAPLHADRAAGADGARRPAPPRLLAGAHPPAAQRCCARASRCGSSTPSRAAAR